MTNPGKKWILIPVLLLSFWGISQPKFGNDAKEIALPSMTGDTIMLSSLKGKVVLLDFWASWCLPCRASHKQLVKLYPKFKFKGFEIFSVSLDDDRIKWKKAVQKNKLSWLQVIDGGGWDTRTAIQWNINAIPTSFLIDKDGKLIAKDLEGKDLENTLRELLGN